MSSITTLIDDLENGSIVGVGSRPMGNSLTESSVLSGTCRISYASI